MNAHEKNRPKTPTEAEALRILREQKARWYEEQGITVLESALEEVVALSYRYYLNDDPLRRAMEISEATIREAQDIRSGGRTPQLNQLEQALDSFRAEKRSLEQDLDNMHEVPMHDTPDIACIRTRIDGLYHKIDETETELDGYKSSWKKALRLQKLIEAVERRRKEYSSRWPVMWERVAYYTYDLIPRLRDKLISIPGHQMLSSVITADRIRNEFLREFTIDSSDFSLDQKFILRGLREKVNKDVVDQPSAIDDIAQLIEINWAGIRGQIGPMGSVLLLGSPNVGKAEVAKSFSLHLTGSRQLLAHIEGPFYQKQGLILPRIDGSDSAGGQLNEAVRRKAYGVILISNVEKCDPGILEIIYNVLEEGKTRDANDRIIDYSNTLIILTSNATAQWSEELQLLKEGRLTPTQIEQMYEIEGLQWTSIDTIDETVTRHVLCRDTTLPIKLLNRICRTINMNRRTLSMAQAMTRKRLSDQQEYLADHTSRPMKFNYTESALAALSERNHAAGIMADDVHRTDFDNIDSMLAEVRNYETVIDGHVVTLDFKPDAQGGRLTLSCDSEELTTQKIM